METNRSEAEKDRRLLVKIKRLGRRAQRLAEVAAKVDARKPIAKRNVQLLRALSNS